MSMSGQHHARFRQLAELLDTRPPAERALIFITISLAIYMLVLVALASPLEKASTAAQKNIALKQAETDLLEMELLTLTENLRKASKESKLIRLEALRNELSNAGKLSELMEDLIPPREIINFVDGILSSNSSSITVVRAKNMPAVQLWPAPEIEATGETEQDTEIEENQPQSLSGEEFTIYRHGMLLEVKGRYRELVSFFSTLEQLPWKILWGNVSLTTDGDNDSVATLVIYTLSPEKVWMGL
jgi:MSHA biogenesis protein MshJ